MVIRMLVAELAFLKKLLLRNNADVINAASFRFAWIDLLNKNENELFSYSASFCTAPNKANNFLDHKMSLMSSKIMMNF